MLFVALLLPSFSPKARKTVGTLCMRTHNVLHVIIKWVTYNKYACYVPIQCTWAIEYSVKFDSILFWLKVKKSGGNLVKNTNLFIDIGNQVLSLAIRCISSCFGKFNIFSRKNTRKKKKNLNHEGHYYDRNSLKINLIIIGKQKHQQRDHFSEMVELIGSWKTLFCYVLSTVILVTVMHQIVLLARDWS